MSRASQLRDELTQAARSQGLELLGVVDLIKESEDFTRFKQWLDRKWHAGMTFLENHQSLREDPRLLLEGSCSAIVLAMPYYLGDKYQVKPSVARIAQYARFKDYHKLLRKKSQAVLAVLGDHVASRVLVDSAPILERSLAKRTELGFIGKNTCYIHPILGSFHLLATLIVDRPLEADTKKALDLNRRDKNLGGCGSCRRCQVYCPTGALSQDYKLDANLCLAYWTIEHRGCIPLQFWPWLAHYWFGCDICQLVCPYNRSSKLTADSEIQIDFSELNLIDVVRMDQSFYETVFGGSPLTRAKRTGLRRNAFIALAARGELKAAELARELSDSDDRVLRDTSEQYWEFVRRV